MKRSIQIFLILYTMFLAGALNNINRHSVGEIGKYILILDGKSGKVTSVGCCFPPKSANPGTLW